MNAASTRRPAVVLFAAGTLLALGAMVHGETADWSPATELTLTPLAILAAPPAPPAPPAPAASGGSQAATVAEAGKFPIKGSYLLSDKRFHDDPEILWPGLLSGLRGFEHFFDPVGNPLYFETPIIATSAKLLYLHHNFDGGSQLQGGHVNVYAAQVRVAVTDRIAIIATKDGYSHIDGSPVLGNESGWNDIALGLKGAFWVDRENDFVASASLRWMWGNGDNNILMGGCQEISPGITLAKGFGDFHLMGNFVYRFPTDSDKGNQVAQWDLHADYDLGSVGLKGIAPIFELHGLHYTSNGTRTGLSVGGLDYTNLGSTDVSGSSVVWAGMGGRVKLTPNFSVGATYEIGLTNQHADIMKDRVTVDFTITW